MARMTELFAIGGIIVACLLYSTLISIREDHHVQL